MYTASGSPSFQCIFPSTSHVPKGVVSLRISLSALRVFSVNHVIYPSLPCLLKGASELMFTQLLVIHVSSIVSLASGITSAVSRGILLPTPHSPAEKKGKKREGKVIKRIEKMENRQIKKKRNSQLF